jgi:hypothetical protein
VAAFRLRFMSLRIVARSVDRVTGSLSDVQRTGNVFSPLDRANLMRFNKLVFVQACIYGNLVRS